MPAMNSVTSLINPADSIERQNEKLMQIAGSLMRRVEQKSEQSGLAYQQFERAALLETKVRERTRDLERTLDLLQESNARLEIANSETERARSNLTEAIETINEGFALFEAEEGLVLSNSRFCRDFLDIEASLVTGLPFEEYVRLISESSYLSLPDSVTPEGWTAQRMRKHGDDHVVFNVGLKWDRWLQVSEHRTSRGGTVILQTDVTTIIRRERHERDRMRDEQAEILQATLDHLNQGVCIFDNNQSLVGWNSRMDGLLAFSPNQAAMGMKFNVLLERLKDELVFEGRMNAVLLKRWANRVMDRRPIAFEVRRSTDQVLSVFAQEMPDQGFVMSFTDVTAERSAARTLSEMNELLERRVQDRTHELGLALAEAERANASKSRFVAAASHDLLQPLSAAKLFVSSLSEQVETDVARNVIDKVDTALNSVEQFISALLDISKLDAGKAFFDVQPVRLSRIFTPLHQELAPLALQKGIDLRVVDCSLTILSDPGYMRRIVQNLLTNAIRYTDRGRVLLGVRRVGDCVRIEVHDTGRGIAVADQLTIFKEFERISPNNSDKGLGLGLSIVERACKELEHDIGLTSAPGQGSCFSVTVPVVSSATVPVSSAVQTSPAPEPEPATPDMLLMLVEGSAELAARMSAVIEHSGGTVIHAHSGDEALELLEEIQLIPDVLLIGHDPAAGADGLAAQEKIQQKYVPVQTIIFAPDVTEALQATCDDRHILAVAMPKDVAAMMRDLMVRLAGRGQGSG